LDAVSLRRLGEPEVRERPDPFVSSRTLHCIACCVLSVPCVFVACCVGRMLLRFEYNLSRMLLVVRCPLLAALEMRQ
jgi:hypothetical protein